MKATLEMEEHSKHILDVISVGTVISTIAGWLPSVASLFTIIWMAIRIWETDTIRGWRGK